jgi:carbon monoxide dehydrogenase subunit G
MPIKTSASIIVAASPEAVFGILTDVARHVEWATGPSAIRKLSDNPARLGTTWLQVSRLLGREMEGEARVNVFEPNRKFGFTSTKPLKGQITFSLEAQADGTRVTIDLDIEPPLFAAFAGSVIAGAAQEQLNRDLRALKARTEKA